MVLTRKAKQIIVLKTECGEVIKVHVNCIRNGQVTIGVCAPITVKVLRHELAEKILWD